MMLPFEERPLARMYHQNAFPIGIIQANNKTDITYWLCDKFINCYFDQSAYNQFKNCIDDYWFVKDGILINQSIILLPDSYEYFSINYIELICQMVKKGFYVNGTYNEEFIPNKKAFGEYYENHDYLIIGFDDSKSAFISVGYLKDGSFSLFSIPYSNMKMALDTLGYEKMRFDFYKYNENYEITLDLEKTAIALKEYYCSVPPVNFNPAKKEFGIKAILSLADYWMYTANKDNWIDNRYTRGLMEQKYFMHKRICYLNSLGIVNEELIQPAELAYKQSEIIHMLGIKYIQTKKITDVEKMKEKVDSIVKIEREYIPELINQIEERMRNQSEE